MRQTFINPVEPNDWLGSIKQVLVRGSDQPIWQQLKYSNGASVAQRRRNHTGSITAALRISRRRNRKRPVPVIPAGSVENIDL